jgi:hypothetical protein
VEKREEKGRKGTNALYYYGMREATNHPFFCPVCLQKWQGIASYLRRITNYTYKNKRERKGKLYIWEMKTGRNVKVSHE